MDGTKDEFVFSSQLNKKKDKSSLLNSSVFPYNPLQINKTSPRQDPFQMSEYQLFESNNNQRNRIRDHRLPERFELSRDRIE